jgi:RHS repeat-associated protein
MLAAETIAPDLPVFPLAAPASVSENPHRGFPHPSTTLHQAIAYSKPLQPPGLPVCRYDFRRRSRCTGKERDAETGLDYFGERYLSSPQGRFTSADALLMKKAWLTDPQRWNRYAYVTNNPLRFVDPNGEDLIVYVFYGQDLTEDERKYLAKHIGQITAGIAAKFKKAGIKNVQFRDAGSLSKEQIHSIQEDGPTGVAFLGFIDKEIHTKDGVDGLGGAKGKTWVSTHTSFVSLENVDEGSLISPASHLDDTTTFRATEVGSHELGHNVGFESNDLVQILSAGSSTYFRSNLMDEGQGVPTRPKYFNPSSEKDQRVIREINKVGDNTPQK